MIPVDPLQPELGVSETPVSKGSVFEPSMVPKPETRLVDLEKDPLLKWCDIFKEAVILMLDTPMALKLFCLWALARGLYVPGRMLQKHYGHPEEVERVAAMFIGGVPVGAAVLLKEASQTNLSVFVMPEYRRQGYGTRLVQAVREHVNRPLYVSIIGLAGQAFWDKVNSTLGGEREFTRV